MLKGLRLVVHLLPIESFFLHKINMKVQNSTVMAIIRLVIENFILHPRIPTNSDWKTVEYLPSGIDVSYFKSQEFSKGLLIVVKIGKAGGVWVKSQFKKEYFGAFHSIS